MNDSILTSVKKLLGIAEEYEHFDPDLIMHINTVLMGLTQIGLGPANGFVIYDKSATWSDLIPKSDAIRVEAVKTYVYLKVKMVFDPPLSSSVAEAINNNIREQEWRISLAVDPHEVKEEVNNDGE